MKVHMMKMASLLRCVALTATLALVSGCVSPVVEHVRSDYWTRQLTETALTTKHTSEQTASFLSLRGWDKKALRDPEPILRELREQLIRDPDRVGLTALAELAFLSGRWAEHSDQKAAYLLTAARASYAVIFDPGMGPMLDPLDPNLRFAADLYNYSLSLLIDILLDGGDTPRVVSDLEMIEGRLEILRGLGIAGEPALAEMLLAFSYKTNALRSHNRRRGIGVPIVAVRPQPPIIEGKTLVHPPVREVAITPATMLLRFREPWRETGPLFRADSELWNTLSTTHVEIGGRRVPLEADTSLSLAMVYGKHAKYRGIVNMPRFLRGQFMVENRGLFLMEPYCATKIPVVFTHGLMDSPLTWVPMLNELLSDPVIKERYQFWVFFYPTMNPILQSASELRQSLLSLHGQMTAEGKAWNDMVLVGHSMGGLITRLMITASGQHFELLEQRALKMGEGDPELQAYLRSLASFEPLLFVHRAIFMGAPHAGATMANRPSGWAGSALTSQPEYIRTFLEAKEGRMERMRHMENGISNLAPDSLFSLALKDSEWNQDVHVHSVIGDLWHAGRTNGSDGVVAYWSSHVENAESELVVHADHLAIHEKTPAIAEVRRILLKHLEE